MSKPKTILENELLDLRLKYAEDPQVLKLLDVIEDYQVYIDSQKTQKETKSVSCPLDKLL